MDDLRTERSFEWQAWVIDMRGLYFDMLSMGFCTTRHWQTSGRLVQELNMCTVHVTCHYTYIYNSIKRTILLTVHAMMAVWSTALPLSASCLSPLPGFESWPWHVRKVPVTWSYVEVVAGSSGFLHQLQLASHAEIWQKNWRKSKFHWCFLTNHKPLQRLS